jgi:predicted RNA binding protein YcfA (HicA-like mRNA interferase family)
MNGWPSTKAGKIFRALEKIGWRFKRQRGTSHIIIERDSWPDYIWAFQDSTELGPKMLTRIAKHTGLTPDDL